MSSSDPLVERSSLTAIQNETLRLQMAVSTGAISIFQALGSRKQEGVSRGTHYRILSQAKKNVVESVFTVLVGVRIGLLRPDDLQKLFATVSKLPQDIDQEKLQEVVSLIDVLVSKLVML